jgi:hypothetical protein
VSHAISPAGFFCRQLPQPLIEAAKHRELLLAMSHHGLMPRNAERPPKTKIANGFQHTAFATAIGAINQVKRRGEGDRIRRQVPEVLCLKFD